MCFRVAFCNMYYVNGIISCNMSECRFDPFLTFHVKPVGKKIHVYVKPCRKSRYIDDCYSIEIQWYISGNHFVLFMILYILLVVMLQDILLIIFLSHS